MVPDTLNTPQHIVLMSHSGERVASTLLKAALRRLHVVPLFIGIVLIIAAGFKGYELAAGPTDRSNSWQPRWLLIALVEFELGLGVWLISGFRSALARGIAFVCFAGFAAVNAYKTWAGDVSCGCFGGGDFHPAYALALDVCGLVALSWWRPNMAARRNTSPEAAASGETSRRAARPFRRLEVAAFSGGLLLLAAGVTIHTWFGPGDEVSRLVTAEPSFFDFGEVTQSQSLTHVFHFRNGWQQPVELVKVHSTCGCTTVKGVVGRVVDPGQSLEVPVTFHTGDSDGQRSGTITLYYRGPSQSVLAHKSVTVLAHVQTDYWVRPTLLDFGIVEGLQPVTRKVRLRPNQLAEVRILGLDSEHPGFSARQIEAPSGDSDLHIHLTFSPTSFWRSGPVSSSIRLHTNSKRVPTTTILARADFRAPVEVQPGAVVIGADVVGKVERDVRVTARQPVRIRAVRCRQPEVRLEPPSAGTAREHVVRLAVAESGNGKGMNTELHLEIELATATDAEEARNVTIPVHRLPQYERTVAP